MDSPIQWPKPKAKKKAKKRIPAKHPRTSRLPSFLAASFVLRMPRVEHAGHTYWEAASPCAYKKKIALPPSMPNSEISHRHTVALRNNFCKQTLPFVNGKVASSKKWLKTPPCKYFQLQNYTDVYLRVFRKFCFTAAGKRCLSPSKRRNCRRSFGPNAWFAPLPQQTRSSPSETLSKFCFTECSR